MPVLVMAIVAAALSAHGANGSCLRTAEGAVESTKLTMKLLGDSPQRIAPSAVDTAICADLAGSGSQDVAISIASGGTAGDVGYAVFQRTASGWSVVLKGNGYKLGLVRVGDELDLSQPVYKKNDSNCCPTGGFDHTRFRDVGGRFVAVKRTHTNTYRP
jgi:hypothetical protein